MNALRIAAAGILAAGAWVAFSRSQVTAQGGGVAYGESWALGDAFGSIADTVTETAGSLLGVDLGSSRYAAALDNTAFASIIAMLRKAEAANGIPAGLLVRQAWQESRFNPLAVNRASGAQGLMQFMPATAKEWGVSVFDPQSSANGAGRYMAWLYGKLGSWSLALAAYNWGIGNVMRKGMAAAPAETRDYVAQIGADAGLS